MHGFTWKAEPLKIYPSVEEIFVEVARQSNTKISIPVISKNIEQHIFKPLTNQEKEEDYEVHLHIITFNLEDTLVEDKNTLQIVIVP